MRVRVLDFLPSFLPYGATHHQVAQATVQQQSGLNGRPLHKRLEELILRNLSAPQAQYVLAESSSRRTPTYVHTRWCGGAPASCAARELGALCVGVLVCSPRMTVHVYILVLSLLARTTVAS